jgi:transglutaminase-like putative cysteine protease
MAKSYVPHYEPAEQKARQLCEGLKTQTEKYQAISGWLTKSFAYDYVRATRVRELFAPNVERCYEMHMGICLDVAALACCMFRAVGIVSNMAIGWVSKEGSRSRQWHAWCEVFVDGKKLLYDQVAEYRNLGLTNTRTKYVYKVSHIRR